MKHIEQSVEELETNKAGKFSGKSWDQMKTAYARQIAKVGDPAMFKQLKGQAAEIEREKIGRHMRSAMALSQAGNPQGAAQQLEAAGYFMHPDVSGKVSPIGDQGFAVQNFDPETGEQKGGYAVTPQNIAEMIYSFEDPAGYADFSWGRQMDVMREERARVELQGQIAERQQNMDMRELQMQTEMLRQQGVMLDNIGKEQQLAFGGAGGGARTGGGRGRAIDDGEEYIPQEQGELYDTAFNTMRDRAAGGSLPENVKTIEDMIGESMGDESIAKFVAQNPFLEAGEDGRARWNSQAEQVARNSIRLMGHSEHSDGSRATADELAAYTWNAMFEPGGSVWFKGGGQGEDGEFKPGVMEINGVNFRFGSDPEAMRAFETLKQVVMQTRKSVFDSQEDIDTNAVMRFEGDRIGFDTHGFASPIDPGTSQAPQNQMAGAGQGEEGSQGLLDGPSLQRARDPEGREADTSGVPPTPGQASRGDPYARGATPQRDSAASRSSAIPDEQSTSGRPQPSQQPGQPRRPGGSQPAPQPGSAPAQGSSARKPTRKDRREALEQMSGEAPSIKRLGNLMMDREEAGSDITLDLERLDQMIQQARQVAEAGGAGSSSAKKHLKDLKRLRSLF